MVRIACAMSGGADSTLAAVMLKEQGHDVIGITMRIFPADAIPEDQIRPDVCCSEKSLRDAAAVAERFGFAHHVFDMVKSFEQDVIEQFCDDYAQGRTPNPCVRCNEKIKYHTFMDRARELGCDQIATGHYAGNGFDEQIGRHLLTLPRDREKDQTYFLFTLNQEQLAHSRYPMAELIKNQVRERLIAYGLGHIAEKPESQDVCFVPMKGYREYVRARRPEAFQPGPIVDSSGKRLGEHDGVANFTIGQRRGLKIAAARPLYVTKILPAENTIVAGDEKDLWRRELTATGCNWIALNEPPRDLRCQAKVRYRAWPAPCTVNASRDGACAVVFDEPQRAITPGQAVVFYDDTLCLGGGWIQ